MEPLFLQRQPLLGQFVSLPQLSYDQEDHYADRKGRKTSRAEKDDCLPLPAGESRVGVPGDRHVQRVLREPVGGQQAVLPRHLADEPTCAALAVPECIDARCKGLSDDRFDARVACEQNAISAIQRDRALLSERNGAENSFEVGQFDGAHNQADERAIGSRELAGEIYGPRSVAGIAHRPAHERCQPRIRLQRLEVILVGSVARRSWPVA